MLKNYLKTALRNLWRFKGYAFINIMGLAIGMGCVILIMMYVQSELGFDKYHENKDRIYRLSIETTNPESGVSAERSIGPFRLADELVPNFPDFEHIIRFAPQGQELVEYDGEQYVEQNLAFVDPNIFQVFDFQLLKGDPGTALEDPFSLVISEDVAHKYFGDLDPLGQTLDIRGSDFEVTGIVEDVPQNSQFGFDMLVSMNCSRQVFSRIVLENWGEGYVETFVMVPGGTRPREYTDRLAAFVAEKLPDWASFSPKINMQPLPRMYLFSQDISSFSTGGDITYIYAFSFIALFILIIACINFMNLATARSSLRAREVGLRKVVGARKTQLVMQFLSESTLLALLALVIGLGLARLALPFFNQLADKSLVMNLMDNQSLLLYLVAITLFVGLAAGSYPALLLSNFKPVTVFSGKIGKGFKGGALRKVLVSFQFATSIFLLIVTSVVYQQLQYCKNINLGFDRSQLIVLGTPTSMRAQYEQFRTELMSNPKIVNAAASSRVPPGRLSSSLQARPEGVPEDQRKGMQTVWTDFDFIETMGFEMASGRSFSRNFPADESTAFIINEAAAKDIGWTNEAAINKTFGSSEILDFNSGQWQVREGRVIGVLKDFYFESLKSEIVPTVYFVAPYMAWNYIIRIQSDDVPSTIHFIEEKWDQFNPETPFQYSFVDDNFAQLYSTEERQGKIFGVFALLAIFIACLGLVGLASFTAEQKKKEVGIRKVLGATSANLIYLLSKEFTILILVAFVIASPISWMVMNNWLEDFAYRISIGIGIFLFAGMLSLLIAWLTVGYQTAKTAYTNPVKALRHE